MGNMPLNMTEQAVWCGASFIGRGGEEGRDRPLVLSTVYLAKCLWPPSAPGGGKGCRGRKR